jgi:hypothetical protein
MFSGGVVASIAKADRPARAAEKQPIDYPAPNSLITDDCIRAA